jgi:hypothetical protein
MNPGTGLQDPLILEGLGFWASGLPGAQALRTFLRDGTVPDAAPPRPSPQLLAPNERRRAPDTVALALEAALAACTEAGRDPATLASVFASTHGDLAITDYMCGTLVTDPRSISPTRFHNSVHNAAAGYWTIGAGCRMPATAVSAYDGSFAQGLIEAAATVHCDRQPVLLVAYDAASRGPLAAVSRSEGLLAAALVLAPMHGGARGPRLRIALQPGDAPDADSALARRLSGNAMAPMLPLIELLATPRNGIAMLRAGQGRCLRVEVQA